MEQPRFWWFRMKGTVINNIWWQVSLVTVYTAGVVCVNELTEIKVQFPASLISVIGVVVGLLLAFRTNSAYDRYWEGRKLWSTMTLHVRTITRSVWIGVRGYEAKDLVEKKSAINLAVAFVIATKHYLREEYSYDSEDIKTLIDHLPRLSTPSSNLPLESQSLMNLNEEGVGESPGFKNSKLSVNNHHSKVDREKSRSIERNPSSSRKLMAYEVPVPTNIPIELSQYFLSYVNYVHENKMAESFIINAMAGALSSMVDCLTSFERILRTPIPLAYSVHLHHSVWLYLLSLPYQLLGMNLHWYAIPIVGLGCFCLLGILSIGWEIENPFGYDDNDLPLDDFCNVIRREVDMITANPPPNPVEWMHSPRNRPLGSRSDINAMELSEQTVPEVQRLLAKYANIEHHWVVTK